MLHDYLKIIQQNRDGYTKTFKVIADYVSDNHHKIAFSSLQELSALTGASTATIHRFCLEMGYNGYTEFQRDVQDAMRNSYHQEISQATGAWESDSILARQIESNIQVLTEMYSDGLNENFNQALMHIMSARNIYVMGMQMDFAMAHIMYAGLRKYLKKRLHLLLPGVGGMMDEVEDVNEHDVLIVVGFRVYSEETIEVIQHFSGRRGCIIAITDKNSPFLMWSDVPLVPSNKTPSYGYVMGVTIIWSIIVAVSHEIKKDKRTNMAARPPLRLADE